MFCLRTLMLFSLLIYTTSIISAGKRQYTQEEAIVLEKLKMKILEDLNISGSHISDIEKRLPEPVIDMQAGLETSNSKIRDTKTMTVINTGPDECSSGMRLLEFTLSPATICGQIRSAYLALKTVHVRDIKRAIIYSGHRRIRGIDIKANRAYNVSGFPRWIRFNIKQDLYLLQWRKSNGSEMKMKLLVTIKCQKGQETEDPPYLRIVKVVQSRKRREVVTSPCSSRSKDCCLATLGVNFDQFGWSFILQPKYFEFQYCKGSCALHPFHNDRQKMLSRQMEHQDVPFVRCCVAVDFVSSPILYDGGAETVLLRHVKWSAAECDCLEK